MKSLIFPTLARFALSLALFATTAAAAADPLPSWNETSRKKAILAFVDQVTKPGSPDFVPPSERVAVFDNDGTLWPEQPMYVQMRFALDRVKTLAPEHPEWKRKQPFKRLLTASPDQMVALNEKELIEIVMATHAGMTTTEFERVVREWIAKARHPRFDRPYTECVYQPMLEVLEYFRANGFKTFIVSGGGIEFMRVFAEDVYGVPPEQIVGTTIKVRLQMTDSGLALLRLPEIDFIDDKAGKPVGIHKFLGRRPIAAFGNSDGDLEMLQYTDALNQPRLKVLIHHTDAQREWAYDRQSPFGRLDKALEAGKEADWTIVDMKQDWKVVFGFPSAGTSGR